MTLSTLELGTCVITILLGLLPCLITKDKIKSTVDYNLGGRNANEVLVAGSIIGTIIGGAATVGTAQLGFTTGIAGIWFTLGSGIALIIMALFYAKPLRNSEATTISKILENSYGSTIGIIGSLSASLGIFFSIVASTLTALHLISTIFNISIVASSCLIVITTTSLIYFGGIKSSGKGGLFKLGTIILAIVYGGVWAYQDLGFYPGIIKSFRNPDFLNLFAPTLQQSVANLISMIIGIISTQTYAQALFSAKDHKTATYGCLLAAFIVIPLGIPSAIIGMFMSLHHPQINSINALPLFLTTYLPDWLGGIGLGALLLSAFGSIAGLTLGTATMFTNDIIFKIKPNLTDKKALYFSRSSVLCLISLSVIFTYYNLQSNVLNWNFLSMALRGCGIFLPLTFAIFLFKKVHPKAALISMLASLIIACSWNYFLGSYVSYIFPSLSIGMLIIIYGIIFNDQLP